LQGRTKRRHSIRESQSSRRRPGPARTSKHRVLPDDGAFGPTTHSPASGTIRAKPTISLDMSKVVGPQVLPSGDFLSETAAGIAEQIDAVIADDDMYEPGEPRPSLEAAAKAKDLVALARRGGRELPRPEVSVYFGEIDVTWKVQNRLLRLIVFSDPGRPPVLYSQTDRGEALTRGESVEAKAEHLSQKVLWLLG
jgi:hypothetical protein